MGLTNADMERYLGSQSRVSEVLNRMKTFIKYDKVTLQGFEDTGRNFIGLNPSARGTKDIITTCFNKCKIRSTFLPVL